MAVTPYDILTLCEAWAKRSKDPDTKVGAAVYDPITGDMFLGYNGFPSGFPDTPEFWERPTKYRFVRHAEVNAVQRAMRAGADLRRCYLVCTHRPCHRCMVDAISASGIATVYYRYFRDDTDTDILVECLGIKVVSISEVLPYGPMLH
jgi:dCMP deaminase